MSRPCSVCRDPRRGSIDTAVLSGEPIRRVAARFQLPEANVRRHASHLAPANSRTLRELDEGWHLDVSQQMGAAQEATLRVLREATAGGDLRVQLQACGTLQKQAEFFYSMTQDRELAEIRQRLEALEQGLTARSNGHAGLITRSSSL